MESEGKGLSEILNNHFDWNKARMNCFAEMLMALIQMRTVNLVKLACAFNSGAKVDSRYKRIQRFFSTFTIDMSVVAGWVMDVFGLDKVYLSMDRTNWKWGKTDINILMLSAVYKGIAFPVLWSLLDKAGNSNTAERIVLIQRFVNRFGKNRIAGVLGDREFIGNDWFAWLKKESIAFCMRIKKNMLTTNSRGTIVYAEELFWDLQVNQQRILSDSRKLWEQTVYLSALRLTDGELLIVATDTLMTDPVAHYGKRWEIETLFGCLKSKGFHFEDTHIVNPARINKLLVLLSVAFCWAHKVGEWRHDEKPIKFKKHGRKSQSLFRYGLDYLSDVFMNKNSRNLLFLPVLVALLSGRHVSTEKT